MNAVYFVAGVLATLAGLVSLSWRGRTPLPKKWASVQTFDWEIRFPFEHPGPLTGMQLAEVVTTSMMNAMEKPNAKELREIIIRKGNYDVRLSVRASFTERES